MNYYLTLFLKGLGMGAANVIPGVSGGTIAFITGIFEEFIDSLKAFDLQALKLVARLRFREFATHVNLRFLLPLFLGTGVSLLSLGKLLDWLFRDYPVWVWSFFFGLIVASVYYVSKVVKRWTPGVVAWFVIGAVAALALAFIKPASENPDPLFVVLCGLVAVCSMILPGISGSFVLILMGNYQLVMLQAVPNLDLRIIAPFAIGAALGFIGLSRLISWLLRHFHDATLSLLTGFILGSLVIIWPWKEDVYLLGDDGLELLKDGDPIVQGYSWHGPDFASQSDWIAFALIAVGVAAVVLLERAAAKK